MTGLTCGMIALMVFTPALGFNMQVTAEAESAKNRPVSKVITLLKDMLKQLEKEGEEDEEVYDKTACWCLTNEKEKTKTIADGQARVSDLTTKIEELTASSSRLNTEIGNLNTEVTANQGALDKATSIRQKQLAEFNSEEKDVLGSISALKSATTVLGKKGAAFLQIPTSHLQGVAAGVQNAMQKQASLLAGVLTHKERKAVSAFLQAPGYVPQGGEIFGILGQMKETFENNLATSQKEEGTNQKEFEGLNAAKEDEIASGQSQVDTKTQELADVDEKNAQSKEDLEDTEKTLTADQDFLASLKEKCTMTDKEWEERQKERQQEQEACSKALSVLSSDDAHDLFTKTFNFVQTEMHSERRTQASKLLSAVGEKMQNPRLATLAMHVKLNAFTKVKEEIDGMVADLNKEQADEIKHKDFCTDEFNTNQLQTEKKTRARSDSTAKIGDLEGTITALNAAMKALKGEIAEMNVQLKRAGEDRAAAKKDFQVTVADQRATQKLLTAALSILKGFYAKKAALVQKSEQPAGFDTMKKSSAAGGVMGMIQQIITDAKAMEVEAVRDDADSQKAYDDFVKTTGASITAKNEDLVNKSGNKAKADADLVEAKEDKDAVMLELEQLSNANAELHKSCDFVVKNFELRQTARSEEIEALKQAKAILSGAKFEAFLQSA